MQLGDVATGEQIRSLVGHKTYVYTVAFSPDGKALATAGGVPTVELKLMSKYDARRSASACRTDGRKILFGGLTRGSRAYMVVTELECGRRSRLRLRTLICIREFGRREEESWGQT